MDTDKDDNLALLQKELGYCFKNESLLTQALTHTTFAYEFLQEPVEDNQRLEFLGDSVLGLVAAQYLYEKHPDFPEGELTRHRARLVNKNYLADRAKAVNLPAYLLLGKGEDKLGGRQNATNLAGALEAIIAVIYLDGGLAAAWKFIVEKIFV